MSVFWKQFLSYLLPAQLLLCAISLAPATTATPQCVDALIENEWNTVLDANAAATEVSCCFSSPTQLLLCYLHYCCT